MIRTQIDHDGAVIAANDPDVLQFGRDTYSYMWPRDGVLTAVALDLAGYGELSRRFFDVCGRVISDKGYFRHKYNPDGSLGSSWHPWYSDGQRQLPIPEDETALVLMEFDSLASWQRFLASERYRELMFELRTLGCTNMALHVWDASPLVPEPVLPPGG